MMNEIWKDIKGFEGLYKVSNYGNVMSLNYNGTGLHKLMKGRVCNNYHQVMLTKDGKKYDRKTHRLVAEAFLPNDNNYPQVNHKDENKLNNNVDNLEWCDVSYNINYGTGNERRRVNNINHKSTSIKVICIETGVVYDSISEAERQTGIKATSICSVCKNKQNTTGGFHWKYKTNNEEI